MPYGSSSAAGDVGLVRKRHADPRGDAVVHRPRGRQLSAWEGVAQTMVVGSNSQQVPELARQERRWPGGWWFVEPEAIESGRAHLTCWRGEATPVGDALNGATTRALWGIPDNEYLSRVQIECEGRPMGAASDAD